MPAFKTFKPSVLSVFVYMIAMVIFACSAMAQPLVVFDQCHAQTAGNADWTITGGFSEMGDAAIFLGCRVQAIKKGPITGEMLKDASIFVTPEPNTKFKKSELEAIKLFVEGGGKLFLISDHEGADRNNDGWDAVMILNEMEDFTGIHFNELWFSESPITGDVIEHPITDGVIACGTWGGTSLSCTGFDAVSLLFESHGGGYIAVSTPGKGLVVAMGDSSPFDDGTGAPGNKLYDGWSNPGFTHERLCLNSLRWLLKRDNDLDNDLKAFGKLLLNSTDSEVRGIQAKLEQAINRHQKTIKKCKSDDVKTIWKEDLEHLRNLKSLLESGEYSKTAIERIRDRIAQFNILHRD